jgi:hypothetical protein
MDLKSQKLDSYLSLLTIEKSQRDQEWKKEFFSVLPEIEFSFSQNSEDFAYYDGHPCMFIAGPNHPQLSATEGDIATTSFEEIISIALSNQLGLILNPDPDQRADWIFRCGDLESYLFAGTPYVESTNFNYSEDEQAPTESSNTSKATVKEGSELYFSPLGEYISQVTMGNLFACIQQFGFEEVSLAIQISKEAGEETIRLVPTIAVDNFAEVDDAHSFVNRLTWLLPSQIGVTMYQSAIEDLFDTIHRAGDAMDAGNSVSISVVSGLNAHFNQESGPSKEGTDWSIELKFGTGELERLIIRTYKEQSQGKSDEQVINAIERFILDELRSGRELSTFSAAAIPFILPGRFL